MEAGFQPQYRPRTVGSSPIEYVYTSCARPKTSDASTPYSITRLRYPLGRADVTYRCEPTTANPPTRWKRPSLSQRPSWVREDVFNPVQKQSIEAWVDEQIHLTDRSNNYDYDRRGGRPEKEALKQRMWDELVYEYEAETQKWMKHEAEVRRRAHEHEREEARKRIVQEDILRIQARVRQRRDSERQAIAEERRRCVERAKEQARRDQVRAERAMLDAWHGYEAGWAAILSASSSDPLGFRDVPWPVVVPPVGVADLKPEHVTEFLMHPVHSGHQSRRERIRMALLRWHPDRFNRILHRVVESEMGMVEEGVGVIVRCLNALLTKEGKVLPQGK